MLFGVANWSFETLKMFVIIEGLLYPLWLYPQSISSTFYLCVFCTKVLFCQNVTREKLRKALLYKKRVRNCWWNWHLVLNKAGISRFVRSHWNVPDIKHFYIKITRFVITLSPAQSDYIKRSAQVNFSAPKIYFYKFW